MKPKFFPTAEDFRRWLEANHTSSDELWVGYYKRATELLSQGRMKPAGVKAFEARQENRSGIYSYENRPETLPDEYQKVFKKNKAAWAFFQSQPAGYRRIAIWWILSAKRDETRLK